MTTEQNNQKKFFIKSHTDGWDGVWSINVIENLKTLENGTFVPEGKFIDYLRIGDMIEYKYVDPRTYEDGNPNEISMNKKGRIIEIQKNMITLLDDNKFKYLLGNNSLVISYKLYREPNKTPKKYVKRIVAVTIFLLGIGIYKFINRK